MHWFNIVTLIVLVICFIRLMSSWERKRLLRRAVFQTIGYFGKVEYFSLRAYLKELGAPITNVEFEETLGDLKYRNLILEQYDRGYFYQIA